MTRATLLALLAFPALACTGEKDLPAADGGDGTDGADASDGADGTDGTDGADASDGTDGTDGDDGEDLVNHLEACTDLDLPIREFDAAGPEAMRRWQPAGDFTVPLRDGTEWTLSENWSGCDNYLFIPHYLTVSDADRSSFWFGGIRDLLRRSPENVHYFFVVDSADSAEGEEFGAAMQAEIDDELSGMRESDAAWWFDRLHVVDGTTAGLDGLVGDAFAASGLALTGFGIDRSQRIRGLGYFSAVGAYDASLDWPWEWRLSQVAGEAEFFNFEAERDQRMAEFEVVEIPIFGGDVIEEYEDGPMVLPDAETMAGFDTLEIEVLMECPDKDGHEIGNCGAWDYLAHLFLWDEASERWLEMGRFITTYHRESHWVLDATHALAWLQDGGERTIRYSWAPSWNVQPTGVTLKLRLSNQGKGVAPREAIELFTGGAFNSSYNDRDPVTVPIPADAAKVELRAIITGHGSDATTSCAEFCRHSHAFSVGSSTYEQGYSTAGTSTGCEQQIDEGTVPNQAGTWWFGRGGWCPGKEVPAFIADVTGDVVPGEDATFTYRATLNGDDPPDQDGNIVLSSWAVVYR